MAWWYQDNIGIMTVNKISRKEFGVMDTLRAAIVYI